MPSRSLRPCACSSPAGPGSSARTSSSGSPPRATRCRARQAHVLRQPGEPGRAPGSSSSSATSATPTPSRRRPTGCDAIVNFAAETHVDRSILGPAEFIQTNVARHAGAARSRARGRHPARARLDRRGLRRRRRGRSLRRGRPAPALEPVLAPRRPAATCRCSARSRTYGVDALITRGSNTYGPNQYPEKLLPLFVTNALDGEPLPLYGDGAPGRDWLYVEDHCAGIELACARARRARSTTSAAARRRRTARSRASCSSIRAPTSSLVRRVEDRAGHDRRYSLDTTKLRDRARLVAAARARAGLRADRRVVPRQPRLVGADQSPASYREYYERQYAARLAGSRLASRSSARPPCRSCSISLRSSLHLLRAVEQLDDAVAAAERAAGEGEVVARVGLGELAGPGEPRDRLLEQRQRRLVVARLHQPEALVVQRGRARRRPAAARRRGGGRRGRRRRAPVVTVSTTVVPGSVTVSFTVRRRRRGVLLAVSSSPPASRAPARTPASSARAEERRDAAARSGRGAGRVACARAPVPARRARSRRRAGRRVERVAERGDEVAAATRSGRSGSFASAAREHVVDLRAAAPD